MNTDGLRSAIRGLIAAIFPVVVLFGIYNFTDAQIVAIMLLVDYVLTLVFLIVKVNPGTTTTLEMETKTTPAKPKAVRRGSR